MFKKIVLTSFAAISAITFNAALAGGVDSPVPAEQPVTYSGTYIDVNLGYGMRDWSDVQDFTGTSTSNINGGFTGNLDVGYQFNEYWSLELGGIYLPYFSETRAGNTDDFYTWAAYGGVKLSVPLVQNLFGFGKVAAAYNDVEGNSNLVQVNAINRAGDSSYWEPLFAFGLQYYFNQNISINAQYTFLSGWGQQNAAQGRTPNLNSFTVGAGYKFAI